MLQMAAFGAPASKISGEILAHRAAKQNRKGLTFEAHQRSLARVGLNENNLDAEDCALYVDERLDESTIQQLATLGITVHASQWVPPLADKHPHGFYLATVKYDSLETVENDDRIVRLESAEFLNEPQNDLAGALINIDDIHAGIGLPALNGSGIKIAVADSGVDLSHPDFPIPVETFDMTDGEDPGTWDTNVHNTVIDHGTHVSGTVVGSGSLSSGQYVGSAPGATFYFYKIGNDSSGSASDTDMVEAVNRAREAGCDVFTMSFGGDTTYYDGTDPISQAIDIAAADGMLVFISAGNEADDDEHDSVSVPTNTTSAVFGYTIDNSGGGSTYTDEERIRVVWRDDSPGDPNNMTLSCLNLDAGESFAVAFSGTSIRGTDARRYNLNPSVAAGLSKTYQFTLQNTANSGTTPLVHCYSVQGKGTFDSPDEFYTVLKPAIADGAIAVGDWTHRKNWVNYQGATNEFTDLIVGTLSPSSSRGPRVDGVIKPDIVAPGSATISTRDTEAGLAATDNLIIDNDGLNLNGSGPADYYVRRGTSMACPIAAGVGALILDHSPELTPAEVREALTSTASNAAMPDALGGYGLIDAISAVKYHEGSSDSFEFAAIASPQTAQSAINVSIAAHDAGGRVVSNFTDSVALEGFSGNTSILITELNPNSPDGLECMNVSSQTIDISGWQIHVYDRNSFPAPLPTFFVPQGTTCSPGDVFTLVEDGTAPGSYPAFEYGDDISMIAPDEAAVLLRDATDNIIDFMCVDTADPSLISVPQPIPANEWQTLAVPEVFSPETYQRIGDVDGNEAFDWTEDTASMGTINNDISSYFPSSLISVPITPTNSGTFVAGQWNGIVTVHQAASSFYFIAKDSNDLEGRSTAIEVLPSTTTSTTSTTSTSTTSTSSTSTTLSPPEIIAVDSIMQIRAIHAPTGTVTPMYSTNLGTVPVEWTTIIGYTNTFLHGTNIIEFDPPDTDSTAVYFHLLQTL